MEAGEVGVGRGQREVHPGGGEPVEPKPLLDRIISDALAAAPQVIAAYAQGEADAAGDRRPALPEPPNVALAMGSPAGPDGQAARQARAEAAHRVDTWLGPLVPPLLAAALG